MSANFTVFHSLFSIVSFSCVEHIECPSSLCAILWFRSCLHFDYILKFQRGQIAPNFAEVSQMLNKSGKPGSRSIAHPCSEVRSDILTKT